ncbi:efflux transporter outer membrane subunit [Litorilituus lipolyticus]|uniref:Efflux transporter outer membrane subunit n=1 Tax=Litorilituus lipolyticus TaxID=2491017 RepID=A0A502KVQ2_9GAMM|nr:efflux transporter outer membrane subunit [Litorilituus lipolyticus]TPH15738.1 efflux transporter outer membrane subunit [Litorilituus lipolyticus]
MNKQFTVAVLSLLITACTLGPDYEKPTLHVQDKFQGAQDYGMAKSSAFINWQQAYKDPELQRLIKKSLAQNYDLAIAISRIKEARALANMADSAFYPTIGLLAESERVSEGSASEYDDTHQLKGQFSWDLDLFGYNRRASEAAWAELAALGQARNVVEMNLVADVASTYFALKDLEEKIQLSQSTVTLRERALHIAQLRKTNGMVSGLDVRQAEVELESAKVTIPNLELQRIETINRMKLLIADEKTHIATSIDLTEQTIPLAIPVGIPSQVLLRRPDVLQVEAQLHAATAEVGMATANLFPKITLTSEFGFESSQLSGLLSGDSSYWELVGGITQPLFNAGRLRNDLTAAEERALQASLAYKKVVMNAFLEISNELMAFKSSETIYLAQEKLLLASREYERLARIRYRNGVASALDLMDAQRKLFDAQLSFSSAKKERLVTFVNLYRALGGGWG